jgi:hypothetical protein
MTQRSICLPDLPARSQTYTHTTNAPTNSPPARKADPSKWSGLDAFAFAVEVKRVAKIQSDFVAGAKS